MQCDPLDVQPQDTEQMHEIDLVSDLMIACSQHADERLPVEVIDAVLHVSRAPTSALQAGTDATRRLVRVRDGQSRLG